MILATLTCPSIYTPHTAPVEVDIIRREHGESLAAYGSLGVLTVNVATETFHYLVLITGCQSVGKVRKHNLAQMPVLLAAYILHLVAVAIATVLSCVGH